MEKFKKDDKVRIIRNHADPHKFQIGEIVTVRSYNNGRYDCTNGRQTWHVDEDCVEAVHNIKVGDWVKCISNDYEYAKNYTIGKKYQILEIDLNHLVQKHQVQSEYGKSYWQEVPGKCFIPCESNEVAMEQVKVGDYVKCISHSNMWSENYIIGNAYEVVSIQEHSIQLKQPNPKHGPLWVPKEDFVLCNPYEPEDSSWKVGDKIQYITDEHAFPGFYDCKVGNVYTINLVDEDGDYKFTDDAGDTVSIIGNERKIFKKIINNQTTTINYVKDNSNNSFELPSSSPAISARQTPRGGIVSSSDLEIWI